MHELAASPLPAWESYYVILGSSAAALTGLMFVVIVLMSDLGPKNSSSQGIATYSTPNIVHFCSVLLISGLLSAPWHGLAAVGAALVLCGIAGIVYSFVIVKRALFLTGYRPVFEDWLWHGVLPLLAYGAIVGAGLLIQRRPSESLFAVGGATLLLVFVGIHNAWDIVTYLAVQHLERQKEKTD